MTVEGAKVRPLPGGVDAYIIKFQEVKTRDEVCGVRLWGCGVRDLSAILLVRKLVSSHLLPALGALLGLTPALCRQNCTVSTPCSSAPASVSASATLMSSMSRTWQAARCTIR